MKQSTDHRLDKQLCLRRFSAKVERDRGDDFIESEIGARLLEHLEPVRLAPRIIADLGVGRGSSLAPLHQRFPDAQIIGVDFSLPVLSVLSSRVALDSTTSLCSDIEHLALRSQSIDLIHANLTLLWCEEPSLVFHEMYRVLQPGGLLVLSTLGPDTLAELRACWAQIDTFPHVHTFPDMHDIGDQLHQAGFTDVVVDAERLTIEYQHLERLFSDLRSLGVGNLSNGRRRTLTGRSRLTALREAYERLRAEGDKLPATFEVAYVHAWVPEPTGVVLPAADFNPFRRRR